MNENKLIVGITIDHVFRNIYSKIIDLYQKFYIDEPSYDAVENNEEFVPPVLTLPITSTNLLNHIPFENEEQLEDFIFSEFPLEVFGYSKESESGSIRIFNDWITKLPSNVEVVLISNEVGRTKPSTLFFLSKTGFEGNNVKFINDSIDIWEICDILVTSSPVKYKPDNKKLIIINKEFNNELKGDINYPSLFDLFNDENLSFNNNKTKKLKLWKKLGNHLLNQKTKMVNLIGKKDYQTLTITNL